MLDASTSDALQKMTGNATGVEDFLKTTLYAAIEDEIAIHNCKRKRGRK